MALNYVTLTLDLYDGQGNPVTKGTATFTPSAQLTDTTDHELITQLPLVASFHVSGSLPVVKLLATDNGAVAPSGWGWSVMFDGMTNPPAAFSFFLPSSPSTQYASALAPTSSVVTMAAYLPLVYPNGAAANYVWTTDADGNGSWEPASGGGGDVASVFGRTGTVTAQSGDYAVAQVTGALAAAGGGGDVGGSFGGTYPNTSVATLPDASALYSGTPRLPGFVQPATVITDFQAGHGWTFSGTGSANLNDTTAGNFIIGTQAVTLNSAGVVSTQSDLRNFSLSAVNATSTNVRLRFRVPSLADMTEFDFYLGSGSGMSSSYKWSIYVPGIADYITNDDWITITLLFSDATVTGSPVKTALTCAQFQIWDNGTSYPVQFQSVELVPDGTARFPAGVVSVCFDDSYSDPQTLGAWEILDAAGFPATLHTITSQLGQGGYIALSDITTRVDRFGWENAGHAFTDADHALTDTGMTAAQLDYDTRSQRAWMIANGIRGTDGFAYPLGQFGLTTDGQSVIQILRRYNAWNRTTSSRMHETWPPADRFRLRAISNISSFSGGITPASVEALVSAVAASGGWLILVFHHISTGAPADTLHCELSDFQAIVSAIQSAGVPVMTIGDVLTHYDLEYGAPVPVSGGGTGAATAAAGFNALSPLTATGDLLYGGASGAGTRLAGNTSATKKYLQQTGTGSASAAPAWGTIGAADLPWTATPAATQLGPADHGLIAWNFAPYNCRASDITAMTAGQLWVVKVPVPYACTISKVGVNMPQGFAASDATTGENYMGLWGPTGTLLSLTGDLSTLVEGGSAPGNLLEALTTPQAVSAGYVYVCAWANGTGTYPALLKGDAGAPVNYNLTGNTAGPASYNAATIAAGYTNAASAGALGTLVGLTTGIPFACVA